jgi:hypothetical protein
MKQVSYIIILSFFSITTVNAQYGIVKNYVYTQPSFAGTIAVDINGNPLTPGVTTSVFIYLKSKSTNIPLFKTALINGKVYSVEISKMKEKTIFIGRDEITQQPIEIKVAAPFCIYRLLISPNIVPALENNKTPLKIKLIGSRGKQKVSYIINQKSIGLFSLPSP